MPLTEFLRMRKGKVDTSQLEASTSDDPSSRPDSDCVELVWENGQITMQGQSSKARKGPSSNNFQALVPKQEDIRMANGSKMTKLSTMDSVLAEFPLSVPSCEMGLDQDVDMVPWLNYSVQDPLHNDYTSDFLRELSGVTINDLPTDNQLVSREKKSDFLNNCQSSAPDNLVSLKHGNLSRAPSNAEKHTRGESSEVPQFSLPFQNNGSKSGISGITGNNTSNAHHVTSRDSVGNLSPLCGFTSLRLQRVDAGQPSTSSGFTNFSYFSRPAAIARANHLNMNDSNRLESDDKRCSLSSGAHANSTVVNLSSGCSQKEIVSRNVSLMPPVNGNSEPLLAKPTEKLQSSNLALREGDVTLKNASQDQAHGTATTTVRVAGERGKEPVVATSSVCSGNSVEKASNEHARDLKRKARETAESDGASDDAEEESVGARKVAPPRTGAKRSRAAEVHNLSERRRRDRINEKMRALQELIPNCNKVDKASMLDEAIEYLKTLQLQVQMLSMGTGLYMQPMVVPPGMQPIHGAQMPQFSPMGVGMGMGMGFGMNMLDVNTGMKLMPFQGPQYPVAGTGPAFHVMAGSSLQPFAHPGPGLTMPIQTAPLLPVSGIPPLKMPMAANVSVGAGSTNAAILATSSNSKDAIPQSLPSNNVNSSVNSASNQAINEGIENPAPPHDQAQAIKNSSGTTTAASRTDTAPS